MSMGLLTSRTQLGRIGFAPRAYMTLQSQLGGVTAAGQVGSFCTFPSMDVNSPWLSLTGLSSMPGTIVTIGAENQQYMGFAAMSQVYGAVRPVSFCFEVTATPALAGDTIQVTMAPVNTTTSIAPSAVNQQQMVAIQGSATAISQFGNGEPAKLKRWYSCADISGMTKAQWQAQPPYAIASTPVAPYAVVMLVRYQTVDGALAAGQIYWNLKCTARFEFSNPNILAS